MSGLERPENIMLGWTEMVVSYDTDIAAHIRHLSTGGRMVITEHIDLV